MSEEAARGASPHLSALRGADGPVATPDLLAGFRDVVRRHPPRIALREGGVGTTYAQLDADSSGLARKLRSLGVGPGVLVGVALHRSARLVTALFAIVKAGGAYVPLDPDYPSERLRFMVDRARVRVVLTVRDLVSRLPAGRRACASMWPKISPAGRRAAVA